jgi:serine/threonine-protein kinase
VGQVIGDYLVVGFLGAGGFGRVYLALQLPILLKAAIKLLDLDLLPESIRESACGRFEAEARALALVQHPNVVRLLHYGSFRRRPYLVMEYVGSAATLEQETFDRAGRGERFALWEVRTLVGQMLDGLAAAHEQNVIHRDVKPGNVMLQRTHGHPLLVRIVDFGLAKFLDAGSRTAAATGTPDYMAPEQIAAGEIGPGTDLFAVGIIAFELLAGQRPFPGADVQQTLFFKMSRGYDPTASIAHLAFPAEVGGFFRRALAWNPGDRFGAVEHFRQAFEAALLALERDAGQPCSRVSLGGLFAGNREPGELEWAPTRKAATRRPSGDEAFRAWLAREQSRLGLGEDPPGRGPGSGT